MRNPAGRYKHEMLEPETLVLKAGVVAITALAVLRVIWHDLSNLLNDIRGKRRR